MSISTSLNEKESALVSAMSVLGDKTRFKMFKLLIDNSELCVSDIAAKLGVSVPAASQHFKIFETAGIVTKQREGMKICHTLNANDPLVKKLIELV